MNKQDIRNLYLKDIESDIVACESLEGYEPFDQLLALNSDLYYDLFSEWGNDSFITRCDLMNHLYHAFEDDGEFSLVHAKYSIDSASHKRFVEIKKKFGLQHDDKALPEAETIVVCKYDQYEVEIDKIYSRLNNNHSGDKYVHIESCAILFDKKCLAFIHDQINPLYEHYKGEYEFKEWLDRIKLAKSLVKQYILQSQHKHIIKG